MGVQFEQREGYLLANISGDYTTQDYRNDHSDILRKLIEAPTRVILTLHGISGIDIHGLSGIETLCWEVARDLEQGIRLASPGEAVARFLRRVRFNLPVYETVDKAYESFEDDDCLDDLFRKLPEGTVVAKK